jgi:hypothetical protein
MDIDKRKENYIVSIACGTEHIVGLENEIKKAFLNSGLNLPVNLYRYNAPPPGSFGFAEGWLDFVGSSLKDILKIPRAVETLANGVAGYMTKNKLEIRIKTENEGAKETIVKISGYGEEATSQIIEQLRKIDQQYK